MEEMGWYKIPTKDGIASFSMFVPIRRRTVRATPLGEERNI
jgi:hypothetical protein